MFMVGPSIRSLTERCSRPRYAPPLMLGIRAGGISLHPDRLSGLLSATPSLLKLASLRASPGGGLVWRKHPAGGKLKQVC